MGERQAEDGNAKGHLGMQKSDDGAMGRGRFRSSVVEVGVGCLLVLNAGVRLGIDAAVRTESATATCDAIRIRKLVITRRAP